MGQVICEWGLPGIEKWRDAASVFVIVDVLSFSTAVSVAVEQGAAVIPFPYGDPDGAAEKARACNALLAQPRAASGGQLTLSPASLRQLGAGSRLVLPSPNGSRLSLATSGRPTLCGCLRNASAVAKRAVEIAGNGIIAVIAAGEQWPDKSLRPAIEDHLGAGAIISACDGEPNAEADFAMTSYRAVRHRLASLIRDSVSGRELIDRGYSGDVGIALELDSSRAVPMLKDGAYCD